MSGGLDVLALKEEDVSKFLVCGTHLGATNCNHQMKQYVFKRKPDGVHIINLKKTWDKLLLAARIIAAVENPADISVLSARPYGQRAILKFATYIGATPIAGRFVPGTFTNQIQAAYREPRLIVATDPRTDHQPITEASYINAPIISLCNTDSPLRHIDIAIPCNNKGVHSIGLVWWLLTREVLRLRGTISREHPWDIMVDLFFYRDPEEIEKEEREALEKAQAAKDSAEDPWPESGTAPPAIAASTEVTDWASEAIPVTTNPIQSYAGNTQDWSGAGGEKDWSGVTGTGAAAAPESKEWASQAPAGKSEWGGGSTEQW
ncbi:40S ribosomal protein SA [Patella vulgata]|uniref:40S ribosomal protein SA n=1 Tax=Patella vulgata TaxID=6465 RepID=UPI00217F8AF8|nr:40S ribosomal protein SA [Patella vulgata]